MFTRVRLSFRVLVITAGIYIIGKSSTSHILNKEQINHVPSPNKIATKH